MSRIKILDSFRGVTALMIVFHHVYTRFYYLYTTQNHKTLHQIFNFISDLNKSALLFFFILSGLSIRLSLKKSGMPVSKPALNDYLFRRFNRILPLYIITLAITALSGVIIRRINTWDFSFMNLAGNMLFLQTSTSYKAYWFSPYGENGPLWSISFEMFYYLFFPFFIYCILQIFKRKNISSRTTLFALSIAFILSLGCISLNKLFYFPYIAYATLFYVWYTGFFVGDLYLKNQLNLNKNLFLLLFYLLITITLDFLVSSASIHMLFLGSLMSSAFYLGYLVRKRLDSDLVSKTETFFNFLFYKIGKGSYAIYLLHYPLVLILLHYRVNNILFVIFLMIILVCICIIVEEYFVKKRFAFLRINYFK